MENSRTRLYISLAVLLAAAIITAIVVQHTGTNVPAGTSTATSTSETASSTQISVTTASGTPATVKMVSLPKPPDFTAPLSFAANVSSDIRSSVTAQYQAAVAILTKNPADPDAWIALGEARKMAGDYTGAATAWQYVSELAPSNQVSFHNLGDLYQNYLHEDAKAVPEYKQAIVNYPHDLDAYKNLFTIYTSGSYNATAGAAEAILKQGIAANPRAFDLQVMLAHYYQSQGDMTQAKTEYDAAIANAQAQGLTTVVAELKSAANGL